jgi:hypothetical protein
MLIVKEIKFDPEDGGSMFLWNIFIRLHGYKPKEHDLNIYRRDNLKAWYKYKLFECMSAGHMSITMSLARATETVQADWKECFQPVLRCSGTVSNYSATELGEARRRNVLWSSVFDEWKLKVI